LRPIHSNVWVAFTFHSPTFYVSSLFSTVMILCISANDGVKSYHFRVKKDQKRINFVVQRMTLDQFRMQN